MSLRDILDRAEPHFSKGGKYERWFVFYEMFDTMLYKPSSVTQSNAHVRDGIDLKRIMMTVWFCTFPALLFGLWNVGYQANTQLLANPDLVGPDGWRGAILSALTGFNPASIWDNLVYGAVFYVPIFIVTYLCGFVWEGLFAWKRGHEVNEGFFVTGMLFTLILPAQIPLWQVALGISFGVVIAKEVFGGTGKNFLNPALTGRAFLYFAYPAQISGDSVWTAVDGYTGATALSLAAQGGIESVVAAGITWSNLFWGQVQGCIGEVSTFGILLGGAFLLYSRIASWRIVAGVMIGMIAISTLLNMIGSDTNPMFNVPWYYHLVMGGFAFGMFFMATDPVSASHTNAGRWVFGMFIGGMTVFIRCINPAFPEGIMLAILFSNLCAPLIDYFVMQANIKRRSLRNA